MNELAELSAQGADLLPGRLALSTPKFDIFTVTDQDVTNFAVALFGSSAVAASVASQTMR